MILRTWGEWIMTLFMGVKYRKQYEDSIRLNHALKRQVIDLTIERDQWHQRYLSLTEGLARNG